MNYHFDEKTLPQLIHLLKGQILDLKDVDWRSSGSELGLGLRREDPPNEGNYRLCIRDVEGFHIHPEGGVKDARVSRLDMMDSGRGFSVSGSGFEVVVRVRRYAVSALGETEKPPGQA